MEQTGDGVLLTGRMRYLLDRLVLWTLSAFSTFLLVVAGVLAVRDGLDSHEYKGALLAGCIFGVLTYGLVLLFARGVARDDQRAKHLLRDAYGAD